MYAESIEPFVYISLYILQMQQLGSSGASGRNAINVFRDELIISAVIPEDITSFGKTYILQDLTPSFVKHDSRRLAIPSIAVKFRQLDPSRKPPFDSI